MGESSPYRILFLSFRHLLSITLNKRLPHLYRKLKQFYLFVFDISKTFLARILSYHFRILQYLFLLEPIRSIYTCFFKATISRLSSLLIPTNNHLHRLSSLIFIHIRIINKRHSFARFTCREYPFF